MTEAPERFIAIPGDERADAAAFLARALRQDEAAVVRLKERADGRIGLWVSTGFEVLATRSVIGSCRPGDLVCDASSLRASLESAVTFIDPGFAMDSAWRGALPATSGFGHVDDVPVRAIVELSRRGAVLARTEGSGHGPATGLLDQVVLEVSASGDAESVGVQLRSLFALTAMGFVRDRDHREITDVSPLDAIAEREPLRVRASATWVRLDARFGSVYQRRADQFSVMVL
ncbi:hypothetical protein HH308_00185 [Gordonia sp. TBRC 11910]|uniref:Uncharacterized protein n=1 Tax=Gordonia asplenii TaxID=2725283 RepID=A0A848KLU5_9ACTN|nr:hypothetical protein [Gordonia asplenii]NMN99635.1 hypothetical protein [Gordonia asplenii]